MNMDSQERMEPEEEEQEAGTSAPNPALMAMDPDHPMLQRAQQALGRQLNAKRMRVEGELREKQTALAVSVPHALLMLCSPGCMQLLLPWPLLQLHLQQLNQ